MSDKTRTLALGAVILATLTLLSGCGREYYDRRDALATSSGDAVRQNIAIHTINPTPSRAWRTHIHTDGRRMENAMERYRTPAQPAATESASSQTTDPGTGEPRPPQPPQ